MVKGGVCQYKETMVWMLSGLTVRGEDNTERLIDKMMKEGGYSAEEKWYVWLGRLVSWGGI